MNPEVWASLVTLTALEIVLGIDNLAFIAILAARLPPERQNSARRLGLALTPRLPVRVDTCYSRLCLSGHAFCQISTVSGG